MRYASGRRTGTIFEKESEHAKGSIRCGNPGQPELSNSWQKVGNGYDDPESGSIAETLSAGKTSRNTTIPGRKGRGDTV